jgi:hypothetical protein
VLEVGGDGLDAPVVRIVRCPPDPERAMGDHLRTGLVAQAARTAVVVRMAVRGDHRVNAAQRHPGPFEARHQRVPRRVTGHPRVDEGDAPLVLEQVAVDVAESRHLDRELQAQHPGGDLGDRLLRWLLLLARRSGLRSHRIRS